MHLLFLFLFSPYLHPYAKEENVCNSSGQKIQPSENIDRDKVSGLMRFCCMNGGHGPVN